MSEDLIQFESILNSLAEDWTPATYDVIKFEDEFPNAAAILMEIAQTRRPFQCQFNRDGSCFDYEIVREGNRIVQKITKRYSAPNRNDPCPCGKLTHGRFLKWKRCCGKSC